jgi:hypothetical protein
MKDINESLIASKKNSSVGVIGYIVAICALLGGLFITYFSTSTGWLNVLGVYAVMSLVMLVLYGFTMIFALTVIDDPKALVKIKLPPSPYMYITYIAWFAVYGKMVYLGWVWTGAVGIMVCIGHLILTPVLKNMHQDCEDRCEDAELKREQELESSNVNIYALENGEVSMKVSLK